jgi:hypothetical protein
MQRTKDRATWLPISRGRRSPSSRFGMRIGCAGAGGAEVPRVEELYASARLRYLHGQHRRGTDRGRVRCGYPQTLLRASGPPPRAGTHLHPQSCHVSPSRARRYLPRVDALSASSAENQPARFALSLSTHSALTPRETRAQDACNSAWSTFMASLRTNL